MKTVNFKRIAIQNFLSVGEEPVVVEFKEGLHILTGNNKDKPERKNAVGKSTVADAIYFSIFGETLREIKKDLIINNITGGKTHVELDFDINSSHGNNTFKVVRTLSPTKVFVYKDGVDKTRDSAANTTKYICDVLSSSPAIFQNCVIMTVNNAVPFMAKNKIDKRKFIEDIFGMEVFSKMISQIRSEYNEIKRQYDIEYSKFEEVEKNYSNYITQREKSIEKKQEQKELYEGRFKNNKDEINTLNDKLKCITLSDVDKLNDEINSLEKKASQCEAKIHTYLEENAATKTTIAHKRDTYLKIGTDGDSCPVCLRPILEHDKNYIVKEKENLKKDIEILAQSMKTISSKVDDVKIVKDKIKAAISSKKLEVSGIALQQQNINNMRDRIKQLEYWQAELIQDIDTLENSSSDLDHLIDDSKLRLEELRASTQSISKNINNLDIVKYIVSEEGVKSYIVNRLLELLNSKLQYYLKKLDANFTCFFNEFFEEEIFNEKNKVCSYFNFSGAERKAIDLACLFTFSDIRRMQGGVSYNIAIYDELFDSSFDEKGIDHITDILKERVDIFNECSIVISHRKESVKAVTGDVIFLEKENGITRRVDYSEF
jgi:DNA repair exonuclease SbcCD ATPase subunit